MRESKFWSNLDCDSQNLLFWIAKPKILSRVARCPEQSRTAKFHKFFFGDLSKDFVPFPSTKSHLHCDPCLALKGWHPTSLDKQFSDSGLFRSAAKTRYTVWLPPCFRVSFLTPSLSQSKIANFGLRNPNLTIIFILAIQISSIKILALAIHVRTTVFFFINFVYDNQILVGPNFDFCNPG